AQGIHCWGLNDDGQIQVPKNLKNPKQVVAGWYHTCALDDSGVVCWGVQNDYDFGQIQVPPGLKNVRSISAGGGHSCAIDDQGVKCWGSNEDGQLEPLIPNPHL
ncbi:MAG: RCC1 domain-containing protein, partial [Bdellovibrionota bacterium]